MDWIQQVHRWEWTWSDTWQKSGHSICVRVLWHSPIKCFYKLTETWLNSLTPRDHQLNSTGPFVHVWWRQRLLSLILSQKHHRDDTRLSPAVFRAVFATAVVRARCRKANTLINTILKFYSFQFYKQNNMTLKCLNNQFSYIKSILNTHQLYLYKNLLIYCSIIIYLYLQGYSIFIYYWYKYYYYYIINNTIYIITQYSQ